MIFLAKIFSLFKWFQTSKNDGNPKLQNMEEYQYKMIGTIERSITIGRVKLINKT